MPALRPRSRVARITGSNDSATNGFVELAPIPDDQIPAAPGQWMEIPIHTDRVFRFVKIEAGPDALIEVAEIEFHTASGKLTGTPFGTAAAKKDSPNTFDKAFDGNPDTYFKADIDHAYVGLDIGPGCQAPAPRLEPAPKPSKDAVNVSLSTWPGGTTIHYTTDGSTPSTQSLRYQKPLAISATTSIAAIASLPGHADSRVAIATYLIGQAAAAQPLVKSYHVGNSLTDTVDGYLEPVALSAGRNYAFSRKTIPGCGLMGNWQSNGQGFGDADYRKVLAAGVDHLFLQVFPNPPGIPNDTDAGLNFINLAQKANPKVQVWLYAQWPAKDSWKTDAHCVGAGWMSPAWFPTNRKPANWDEAMANKMEYYRLILKQWNEKNTGQPALLCPGGPALVRLETAIGAGEIPGMKDFFATIFADGIHLSAPGRHLVALVHYACIFKESPEGKVTWANSGLTKEQAAIFQKIAWETAVAEPSAGLKPAAK